MATLQKHFLASKNIAYLDDNKKVLKEVSDFFRNQGYGIISLHDVEEAKVMAANGSIDIFLCDFKLHDLTLTTNGLQVLTSIRRSNKKIFLALYSAYTNHLTPDERILLEKASVYIFQKEEYELLMLNLIEDYCDFVEQSKHARREFRDVVVDDLKKRVLEHLDNVSDKGSIVQLGEKNFTIIQLIDEIEDESPDGAIYVKKWLDVFTLINKVKENGKRKKYFIF